MQLSDEEVEAKLAKMRGASGRGGQPEVRVRVRVRVRVSPNLNPNPNPNPNEGGNGPGVVLGVEALEVGVVLVPLLALALFCLEEYVRARL